MRQATFARNRFADRPSMDSSTSMTQQQSMLPVIGGGFLLLYGLGRRNLFRTVTLLLGGFLLYDGINKSGGVQNFIRQLSDRIGGQNLDRRNYGMRQPQGTMAGMDEDVVKEASEESFPASDAPSWTPTTSLGSSKH